jgi:hypothetical protein
MQYKIDIFVLLIQLEAISGQKITAGNNPALSQFYLFN